MTEQPLSSGSKEKPEWDEAGIDELDRWEFSKVNQPIAVDSDLLFISVWYYSS